MAPETPQRGVGRMEEEHLAEKRPVGLHHKPEP